MKIKRVLSLAIILILFISNVSYGEEYSVTNEVPVLLYHHITSQEEIETHNWKSNGSVISIEKFNEQITYLKENNYYTATLEELELFIDGEIDLPEKTIVITFDDGYLSNIEYAYPIMKENGFRASIFMVGETATRDESNLSPGELLHIPAEDVHKYKDVFEFGSHTFNLHSRDENRTPLLIASSKEDILEDLARNQKLFNSKYFAYPYGSYISTTIKYIEELGHTMAFTVSQGFVTRETHKYQIPRISMSPKASLEEFENRITLRKPE